MANEKLIVAHRGGSSRWHENTAEAVQYAIECGADMVEFDVRRTADGELIVNHDETIDDCLLTDIDYDEAVRRSAALGYRIPRLSEILEISSGRILLDVELKESGYEDSVLRLVSDRGFRVSEFVITSFEETALEHIRQASSHAVTGLLVYGGTGEQALERFHQVDADFLGPDYLLLDQATLHNAQAATVPLLPWTVNEPTVITTLLRARAVAGIISDQTIEALRLRDEEFGPVTKPDALPWRRQ